MSSLPEHACLDHYRRQAKDLFRSYTAGDTVATDLFRKYHPAALNKPKLRLTDAQHVVARREGFASWPKLKAAVVESETRDFFDEVQRGDVESAKKRLSRLPILAKAIAEGGETALHIAAEGNDVSLAEPLIKAGADLKRMYGYSAHTAMSWAITVGSMEFARELVRLGDKPDLFGAAGMGDLNLVRSFWVDGKLRPNASTTGSSRFAADGSRLHRPPETEAEIISDAFVMACRNGQLDVAVWLLSKGADLSFRGYIGGTGLHWAEYSGNQELCEVLRSNGASDESEDDSFRARPRAFGMIVPAAWGLVPRLIRRLDAYPEDVDIRGGYGTPLNAAAWNGQIEGVRVLLSRGADPMATNAAGATPLDVARHREFPGLVALFESLG